MAFSAPFRRTFSPTFDRRNTTSVNAWWTLNGVIPAANCIAAYQPKGAASIGASYVNLANPGTYNAAPGTAPSFATATGWTFAAASSQYLGTGLTVNSASGWSLFVRFVRTAHTVSGGITANGANYFTGFGFYSYAVGNVAIANGGKYIAGPANTLGVEQTLAVCNLATYIDGVFSANMTAAGANANADVFIGKGGGTNYYTGSIYAIAIYDNSQASNAAAITAAMQAL